MASAQTIQALCQTGAAQKYYGLQYVGQVRDLPPKLQTASKICDSLNFCAPHKK
jgi:hypothetical protein